LPSLRPSFPTSSLATIACYPRQHPPPLGDCIIGALIRAARPRPRRMPTLDIELADPSSKTKIVQEEFLVLRSRPVGGYLCLGARMILWTRVRNAFTASMDTILRSFQSSDFNFFSLDFFWFGSEHSDGKGNALEIRQHAHCTTPPLLDTDSSYPSFVLHFSFSFLDLSCFHLGNLWVRGKSCI